MMKRVIHAMLVTALVCIIPINSIAQLKNTSQDEKSQPATKLEQFLSKKGTLYIKDFYNAGNLSGKYSAQITTQAVIVYEPGHEKEKIRGLKIEIIESGRIENRVSAFLDIDEVESLIKAIDYMAGFIEKYKTIEHESREVVFATKGYFKFGFIQAGSEITLFASNGFIREAHCFLSSDMLMNLRANIEYGLSLAKK